MCDSKTVTKLDIPRNKWGSGSLLRADGRMCCLGHLSAACGISASDLSGKFFPQYNWNSVPLWARSNIDPAAGAPSGLHAAVSTNDNVYISWEDKEERLIELFKSKGIELTFSGEKDYQV